MEESVLQSKIRDNKDVQEEILENNGYGLHYFFNKKNTIYAKMLICQDTEKNRDGLKYILHKKDIKPA